MMYMGVCQNPKKCLMFKGLNLRSSCLVLSYCFSVPLLEVGALHPIQKTRQLTDKLLPLEESPQLQPLTAETLHNCKNTQLV